jgi:hypothetical protein
VISDSLPAGSYVIVFTVGVNNGLDAGEPVDVKCDLGGVTGEAAASETLPVPTEGATVAAHMTVVHSVTLASTTTVTGQCTDNSEPGTQQAFFGRMVATRVATITP